MCVVRIALVGSHVRLDILRRDDPDREAQLGDLARPVMGAPACLQAHDASPLTGKPAQNLIPPQPASFDDVSLVVLATDLKHILCDIKPDRINLLHNSSPFHCIAITTVMAGTMMPPWEGRSP